MDEHRLGLKPIHRRVWAPIGERPIAFGHHRYEWLYVTAFVAPASGETVWFLSNGIDKPFFAKLLEAFARATGAGRDRIIVLQLDNAGWRGPEKPRRSRRHQARLPTSLQPGTATSRAPLAARRRSARQQTLRHNRRSRCRRRHAMLPSPSRSQHDRPAHQLPLVAKIRRPELITRKPYDLRNGYADSDIGISTLSWIE